MSGVWGLVPLLSSTEALCLLAMAHIDEEAPAPPEYVEVDQVAAATGLSVGTAGAALRQLAKAEHLEVVPYLATASNGRPCARVGYRLGEAAK